MQSITQNLPSLKYNTKELHPTSSFVIICLISTFPYQIMNSMMGGIMSVHHFILSELSEWNPITPLLAHTEITFLKYPSHISISLCIFPIKEMKIGKNDWACLVAPFSLGSYLPSPHFQDLSHLSVGKVYPGLALQ